MRKASSLSDHDLSYFLLLVPCKTEGCQIFALRKKPHCIPVGQVWLAGQCQGLAAPSDTSSWHCSGMGVSSPTGDPIPEGCQIPSVPLVPSEHPLYNERGSQPASEPMLGEEEMRTHQEDTMGWLSGATRREGTTQEQIREGRAGHGFSSVQLSMPSGLGAAEMSSANNPPALCTPTIAYGTLQIGH